MSARSATLALLAVVTLAAHAAGQRRNPDPSGGGEVATPREPAPAAPRESAPPPSPPGRTDAGRAADKGNTQQAVPRTGPPPERGSAGTVIIDRGQGGYGYGGYYGGYYDPYDPERSYPDPAVAPRLYEEGKLRLKIKPKQASVYIDGYYTGIVDDMDGLFQKLRIEAGPHRIEVQEPGFETLRFNVRIDPRRTTTYRGGLTKMP
jgi:hypothetical protein